MSEEQLRARDAAQARVEQAVRGWCGPVNQFLDMLAGVQPSEH
jgi:hypothetical protein